ncbi:MAG: hypothetical protein II956_07870 [Bacteroidales bacterium]|nr:hypothetical protein [Bacteroidales bacterium]
MKVFFLLFSFLAFLNLKNANCQIVRYANDFLLTGDFSALEATSGSKIAAISGSEAVFSNPSNLFFEDYKADFSIMHNNYFSSMANLDLFSASYKADTALYLGLGFLRFGVDDIQNTIYLFDNQGNMDYSRIKYFSVADYAAFLSVAKKWKGFNFGCSMKLIYRHEGNFAKAYGFGFDIAATYQKKNFALSAVIKDVTTTFDFWSINQSAFDSVYLSTGNTVPENKLEQTAPSLILAAAYSKAVQKFNFSAFFATTLYYYTADLKFGTEVSYSDIVFLRFGLSDFQNDNNLTISKKFTVSPSFGIGVKFLRFRLDYAFKKQNAIEKTSNVFTIGVKI